MSAPLDTTFRLLATAAGDASASLLTRALEVPSDAVQAAAVAAVVRRGDLLRQVRLVERWPGLGEAARLAVVEAAGPLARAVHQCLAHGTAEIRANAVEVVRAGGMVAHLPTLVGLLCRDAAPPEATLDTFRRLADRLYELQRDNPEGAAARQAAAVRTDLLTALDRSAELFGQVPAGPLLVETALAFGSARHPLTRAMFHPGDAARRKLAVAVLSESRHPGVMAVAFDFLGEKYPHARALDAVRTRQDPEFVAALLRWLPEKPTEVQAENLRQVGEVAWLDEPEQRLVELPGALQRPLLRFLVLADIDGPVREEVREWVLRFGEPDARAFALRELGPMPTEAVRAVVSDGLESEDGRIQAWALTEARACRIPDAMKRLIEALDSDRPEVVEAARGELASFNLPWLLANLDRITPAEGEWVGRLLRKVNPLLAEDLTAELLHPIRGRRVRAAYAARALNLQEAVLPALLRMLDDEDAPVRRVAVDVLSDVPTAAVRSALVAHADDPSPRVREAVEAALAGSAIPAAAEQEALP